MRAALLLLTLGGAAAYACTCDVPRSSVEAYSRADAIVVADVTEVVAKRFPFQNRGFVAGQSVTVRVREAFKGFAEGTDVTFDNAFSSCNGEFQRGEQFLFRLWREPQSGKLRHVSCGTRRLKDASEDLIFLRAFRGVPGKHRVAGAVELYEITPFPGYRRVAALAKVPVRIVSKDFEKSLVTNAAGVFEAYDVPAGRYRVEVEPPAGLKLHHPKQDVWIEVTPTSSVEVGLVLTHDLTVFGKVLDAEGRPLEGVCVVLLHADVAATDSYLRSCAKADGSYRVEDVPPGAYWLVANAAGTVTARSPIGRTFYPGVEVPSDAHVIQMQAAKPRRELNFRLARTSPRFALRGRVQFQDGSPAPWTEVRIFASDEIDTSRTNERGEFQVFALRGTVAYLQAELWMLLDEKEIAAAGCSEQWKTRTFKSARLPVTASQNRDGLVVTFPMAACKPWLDQQSEIQKMEAREH